MLVFIGGLIEGILSFVTDIWLLRKNRSINKRPENSWETDAASVAHLEWALAMWSVVAVGCFAVLFFWAGLSFGVSFFVSVVPLALYGGYRWIKLLKA